MHGIIGFLFAMLFSVMAQAQEIQGIGDIRVGMSEAEFLELPDIKSKNIQDAANKGHRSDRDMRKITSESQISVWYSRIFTPEYVKYEFKMATGIKDYSGKDVYDATVEFYKGELIKIMLNTSASVSNFKDILTEKYGKPTVIDTMKKEICQNSYGAKTEHNTGSIIWGWGDNGQIEASMTISSFGCGKFSASFYTISHSKKSSLVIDLERKSRQDAEKEQLKEKAGSSKL